MEENITWFHEKRALAAIESLKKNRMNGVYLPDSAPAVEKALFMIPSDSTVAMSGSITMVQTGLVEALRKADLNLIDRYEQGISAQEISACFRAGLTADVFVSGVNAITEQGELVFVDATCNRVAGVLFGPAKVIIVAGCNKIVPNLAYAQERICNATVVVHKQANPDRLHVLLVNSDLGY